MAREISARQARQTHGVWALHEQMDNGEFRFRLKHASGAAYVRTEATIDSGWQRSHWHKTVRETYIVEAGWMAYAELVGGAMRIRILHAHEVLTTQPGVVHNVFLPAEATIHTVKHGAGEGEDRHSDGEAPVLDLLVSDLDSEAKVRAAAYRQSATATYSEAYRHFDSLIWQVPAWSTAIFALASPMVLDAATLPAGSAGERNVAGFTVFLSLCLMVFATVLYRFRVHQRSLKAYSRTRYWKSAQTWTQGVISAQCAILLGAGLDMLFLDRTGSVAVAAFVGFGCWVLAEVLVRRERITPI